MKPFFPGWLKSTTLEFQTNAYSVSTPSAFLISLTGLPFQNSAKFSIDVKDLVRMRSM
jgi:hypothetical protein